MYSIGIITAEQTLHSIMQVEREMRERCKVTYLPYSSLEHLYEVYQENAERFDALLFSGSYPYHVILERFGSIPQPHAFFTISDRDYYCLIAQLAVQEPGLDFSRVFIDEPEIPVNFEMIFGRPGIPLQSNGSVPDYPHASVYQRSLDHYRRLWASGQVDLIVTRFRSMEHYFQADGIRYRFILPSPETMLETFRGLELRLTTERVHDAASCVGLVVPRETEDRREAVMDQLQRQLESCNRRMGEIFLIYRHGDRVELTCNVSTLRELTEQYTVCPVTAQLRDALPFAVAVGWGCADNVVDAHRNAQRGVTEAMGSGGLPAYVVTGDGCLLGLTARKQRLAPPAPVGKDALERCSRQSGVSLRYIRRIHELLSTRRDDSLSAEELADALELTPRSALRILDKLSGSGLASVQYSRPLNRPGRPAKRYRIRFEGI
ncbi:MAG: hypothetical protein IJE26_00700 [Oscillospiraceae bacterium]|nr:hypothetical protein [Oscillospiraceae bacterium]